MAKINDEIKNFLAEAGITGRDLARESGVHEVYIARLKLGQHDTSSANADAIRAAMRKINPILADKILFSHETTKAE